MLPTSHRTTRFLLASLHVQALEECDTIMSIKEAANTLPTDLNSLYKSTVDRIRRFKPERARIGLLALLWVTHAKRPLDIVELQEALGTKYTAGSLELGRFNVDAVPDKNVILASACGLLTVDASDKVRLMRESFVFCGSADS